MENPIKMDDLGGTIIFGNTHIWKSENKALSIPSWAKNSSAKSWSSMNQVTKSVEMSVGLKQTL